MDDPREILRAAGVECAEVEALCDDDDASLKLLVELAPNIAADAVLALARLAVRFKVVAESAIPPGIYCYSKTASMDGGGRRLLDLCPYWSRRDDKPEQENGHCAYLGEGDWDAGGLSLLWDQCKECGVNEGYDGEHNA